MNTLCKFLHDVLGKSNKFKTPLLFPVNFFYAVFKIHKSYEHKDHENNNKTHRYTIDKKKILPPSESKQ